MRRLEGHSALLGGLGEWDTKLEQFQENIGEVLEEKLFIRCVFDDPLLELLVRDKGQVGWKHHQGLGGLILVLMSELVGASSIWTSVNIPA